MFFHPGRKKKTSYLIQVRPSPGSEIERKFLMKVPTTVTSHTSPYWRKPKLTTYPLLAQFFPTYVAANSYRKSMQLDRYRVTALEYRTRPSYEGPDDANFTIARDEVKQLIEQLSYDKINPAVPDITRARLALDQLSILSDIYDDWEESGIAYSTEEEIEFLAAAARLCYHPIHDLRLLNSAMDKLAARLKSQNIPFTRDDLWMEYVHLTPVQRQAFITSFRTEVFEKRRSVKPGVRHVRKETTRSDDPVLLQQPVVREVATPDGPRSGS
jgi:hypothetical protein